MYIINFKLYIINSLSVWCTVKHLFLFVVFFFCSSRASLLTIRLVHVAAPFPSVFPVRHLLGVLWLASAHRSHLSSLSVCTMGSGAGVRCLCLFLGELFGVLGWESCEPSQVLLAAWSSVTLGALVRLLFSFMSLSVSRLAASFFHLFTSLNQGFIRHIHVIKEILYLGFDLVIRQACTNWPQVLLYDQVSTVVFPGLSVLWAKKEPVF